MNAQITKIDSNVISSLRMPLAFLVVLWHACGYGMIADQTMSFTNGLFDTIKILFSEGICIISVPIFFVISGFLFEAHFCRCQWSFCNYKEYIIKKLARLVVPYLLWNVIFLVAFYLLKLAGDFIETGSVNYSFCEYVGENKGFQLFAYGNEGFPINYPLWFVRDLIIVNLLYPILYFLNQYSGGGYFADNQLVVYSQLRRLSASFHSIRGNFIFLCWNVLKKECKGFGCLGRT